MAVTHLRVIFPLGFDPKHLIKTFWDEKEQCLMGAVFHYNMYWNGMEPSFMPDMDVHVGIQREPERDLFGKMAAVPAQGLLRGEYVRWERCSVPDQRGGPYACGWLVFRLRYDMQEGPEIWNSDLNTVHTHTDQQPAFYYAMERHDE